MRPADDLNPAALMKDQTRIARLVGQTFDRIGNLLP
jgi:hypothetical protein